MSLAALNLSTAANEGRPLHLLHPGDRTPLKTADGEPVTITLRGRDSEAFIKAQYEARERTLEAVAQQTRLTGADQDMSTAETLAACTVSWAGIPQGWIDGTLDESPAPFSEAAARKLYANPGVRWLREQADAFVGKRSNFVKAASAG